jgi:hypothetical protein
VRRMSDSICDQLVKLRPREVEECQGFVSALAALVNTSNAQVDTHHLRGSQGLSKCLSLAHLWELCKTKLNFEDKAFTSFAMRPEYTASSVCNFIAAMASMTNSLPKESWPPKLPTTEVSRLLELSLTRQEESVLEAVKGASQSLLLLLARVSRSERETLISGWLERLENETSYSGLRCSGYAIALGAAYGVPEFQDVEGGTAPNTTVTAFRMRIIKTLTFRTTAAVAIEARTVALRALDILLKNCRETTGSSSAPPISDVRDQVASALHIALNDYTVTERGDVGSLVRLEALNTVRTAWTSGFLQDRNVESDRQIYADVLRLSLEKLDKMRARAAAVIEKGYPTFSNSATNVSDDVSSIAYFTRALETLQSTDADIVRESIILGLMSSAGTASESVVQNSRAALLGFISTLPDTGAPDVPNLSLQDLADCVLGLLKKNLDNDRVLLPLLEVLAFLFDMQVMQRLIPTDFKFRVLLSYVQKAHFKSTHMQKLHISLDVYRGLSTIPSTHYDTLTKVVSMLLHPFPKVCPVNYWRCL